MSVFEISFKAMLVFFAIFLLSDLLIDAPSGKSRLFAIVCGASFAAAFISLIIAIATFGI